MHYLLSNGEKVLLNTNNDVAKFVLFVMPREGLRFIGTQPKLIQTPHVKKLFEISKKLALKRKGIANEHSVPF